MARTASVDLDWGDDTYTFRLGIGELIELDEKCNAGPGHMLQTIVTDTYRVVYIRETIRIGLIGGGTPSLDALRLVRRYFDDTPLAPHLLTAEAILAAAIVGREDDTLEKKPESPPESSESEEESVSLSS